MNGTDFLATLVIGTTAFVVLATVIGLVHLISVRREMLRFGPRQVDASRKFQQRCEHRRGGWA